MTTSSAQGEYSTISFNSTDTITLTQSQLDAINTSNITISSSGSGYSTFCFNTPSSYSYTSGTSSICIPPLTINSIDSLWGGSEWVNSFPAWGRIEEMCKEYPALKIAFEKFKHTYEMVKEDFDTPTEKRVRP